MSAISTEVDRRIDLPPANDIRTCGQLKNRLAECLSSKCILILDVGAFQSGDITFVQTLVSAVKTAARLGGRLEITNAPPAFAALLERCGLGCQLHAHPFSGPANTMRICHEQDGVVRR